MTKQCEKRKQSSQGMVGPYPLQSTERGNVFQVQVLNYLNTLKIMHILYNIEKKTNNLTVSFIKDCTWNICHHSLI